MEKQERKEIILKFLAETKEGKFSEIEKSSLEYARINVETDLSSEYSDYVYSVR